MSGIHAIRNRFLDSRAARKLCGFWGIHPQQYRLLIDLFALLSDRMEFMGMSVGLNRAVGAYFAASLFLSLPAFFGITLSGYLSIMMGYTLLFMFYMLLMDAANSIMNPDEASVLAHQPIRGATYVAAKLTHLLVLIAVIVPALNLFPAIAGLYLKDARWFYPLTHLMAAYLAGLFVAFFVCGIYGWLYLVVPPRKLKNSVLGLHMSAFPLMVIFNTVLMNREAVRRLPHVLESAWMPWRWFVAVGLMGHAKYPGFSTWEGIAAVLVTLAFIAFGLRAFRADYLIRVSAMIQGSAASIKRTAQVSWLNPLVRKIACAPSGYGAFVFINTMLRRDWNIRRQALPIVGMYIIYPLLLTIANIRHSPFVSGELSIRSFSPMHTLPHILGIGLLVLCPLISFSAEPQGAAMFIPLPIGRLRPFVRGMYLSLFFPLGTIHLVLLGPCMWFWGIPQGALFVGFSAALISLYLGLTMLLMDGFPFANAFKPSAASELPVLVLLGLIPAFIFAIIQWLVFRNAFVVLASVVVMVLLSLGVAHFSLGSLEKKLQIQMKLLGIGPQKMFREMT